jgi:hypothetical protein
VALEAKDLSGINVEVIKSKDTLEKLVNDMGAVFEILAPKLIDQVKRMREHRMAVVREVQESLSALRDIRKFFLDADYEREMERLERFIRACREIEALKASGTLDAVCDTLIKLMLKGESV